MLIIGHNLRLIIGKVTKQPPLHHSPSQYRNLRHRHNLLRALIDLKPDIVLSQDLLHQGPLILTPKLGGHQGTDTRLTGNRFVQPIAQYHRWHNDNKLFKDRQVFRLISSQ